MGSPDYLFDMVTGFDLVPGWLPRLVVLGALTLQVMFVLGNSVRPKYRRLHGWRSPLIALRNSLLPTLPTQIYLWSTLVLLLLVLWWVCSGLVYAFRQVWSAEVDWLDETVLLIAIVATIHVWFLVRGFTGQHMNQAFASSILTDEQPPAVRKRVAVIGAGMAGLVAARS